MGFIRKFAIYGLIVLLLLALPTQSKKRWRRQADPSFTPLQSIRSPWIPIKDSRPRLIRQDNEATQPAQIPTRPLVFNPVLRQERPVVQSQRDAVPQEPQRARQLAQSGDWIPLAPLDSAINAVEDEARQPQFNPIVTLNTIPGKRLPITALDPLLFSRDQSVVLPSTRPVLPELFPATPTQIFINQPITPTPVTTPQANQRPLPAISVQSVPARVNENRRPGLPPRISRPQTTTTITTIQTNLVDINRISTSQGTTTEVASTSTSTPSTIIALESVTTAKAQSSESVTTAKAQSSESVTTAKAQSSVSTETQPSSTQSTQSLSSLLAMRNIAEAENVPIAESINSTSTTTSESSVSEISTSAAPIEITATSAATKAGEVPASSTSEPLRANNLPASVGELPPRKAEIPDANSEESVKVVDVPLLGPFLDVTQGSTENHNITSSTEVFLSGSSDEASDADKEREALARFDEISSSNEETEDQTEVMQQSSEAPELFPGSVEPATDKEQSKEAEEPVSSTSEKVPNGHQGRLPPLFDFADNETPADSREAIRVEKPFVVLPPTDDSGEVDVDEHEINSPKVMNAHQPPITEINVDETSDSTDVDIPDDETSSEDYGDYNISPPGLLFNFTDDFNVSLVDFGNGTFVLENQTYILPPDSSHADNGTFDGVHFESEEETSVRSKMNSTVNEGHSVEESDSVLFESEIGNETVSESSDKKNGTNLFDDVIVFELTSTRHPSSELEIVEVMTTVTPNMSTSSFTSHSESVSSSTSVPPEESANSAVVSSTESVSSSTVAETSPKIAETSSASSETTPTPSSPPVSSEVETSRELDKQTTPLATIINSIISALTTQKTDQTTVSLLPERETTTLPTTTPIHSTRQTEASSENTTNATRNENPTTTAIPAVQNDFTSENTQEPEPRVPLYIRIDVDLNWRELCEKMDEFKSTLAQIVSNDPDIGTTISPRQIVVYNIARCALELHSSRRRRHVSEPAVALCYVTDYHGVYSHRLTEALSRGLNFGSRSPAPFAEKIMSAMPIKSTSESLAVGTQHVPTTGMIAGITVAVILGLILLAFLVFLLVVRRRQNRATFARRCEPGSEFGIRNSIRNLSWRGSKSQLRASKRSFVNYAYEDPNAPTRPLNASRIADVSQDVATLEKEFKQIPMPATTLDDLPSGVESKNRFSNVIPVPETRVLLKPIAGDEASEYINANYIRGPRDEPQYYIACQAPLESTVPDFWRMIWEKQSKLIIQLTDLFENGSAKCADYLPPSEVLDCHRLYGDFQVTLKRRELKQGYIVSFITLKHMNDNLRRDVVHYWFTGWPHTGVPEDPKQLVSMLSESRTASRDGTSPIVVHCCPGTGRTGTVIAIELLMRIVDSKKTVDVPRSVYKIRRDRSGSVQTKEQYQFIYQAVAWYVSSLQSVEASK